MIRLGEADDLCLKAPIAGLRRHDRSPLLNPVKRRMRGDRELGRMLAVG